MRVNLRRWMELQRPRVTQASLAARLTASGFRTTQPSVHRVLSGAAPLTDAWVNALEAVTGLSPNQLFDRELILAPVEALELAGE